MLFKLIVDVDPNIVLSTAQESDNDITSVEEAIIAEMNWVTESGIYLESVEEIKEDI